MLRSNSTKWIVALIVVALITASGMTVGIGDQSFTTQTAIGQSSENLSQDFSYLERVNRAFINVVNRAKPAVVQIATTKLATVGRPQSPFDSFHNDDLFRYWFGPRNRGEQPERERHNRDEPEEKQEVPGGLGSGVIVSEDGYILTNNHVIEGAEDIQVILPNGREYPAEVVGKDSGAQGTDLAVLKIDGKGLPALNFGSSDELQVGEWVIAIGSPFGLAQTVTRGLVSAKGRSRTDIGVARYADFIQTDAAINRGNSGGALINIRGQLIGINTAIATSGGFSPGNVGVGFAIPINLAQRIMSQLIEKGEVERGWLGVDLQTVDYDLAEKLKLGEPKGALIRRVGPGMPADNGGVERGDVIVEFNHVPIRDVNHLMHVVAGTEVGQTAEVKVVRNGKEKALKITLGKRTEEVLAALGDGRSSRFIPDREGGQAFAGLHVQDLTDELAERYGHEGEVGVVVSEVERRSPAAKAKINAGDLIQEIEGKEIRNLKEYHKLIQEVQNEPKILLYVRNVNGIPAFVTLRNTPEDN